MKNKSWPTLWRSEIIFGKMKLTGFGYTPKEAYDRVMNEPTAINSHGFNMRSE